MIRPIVCCWNVSLLGHWAGESLACFKDTALPVCLQKCAEIIVAHLSYLNYTQYTVTVGFEHLRLPLKDVNFTVSAADCRGSGSLVPLPLFG